MVAYPIAIDTNAAHIQPLAANASAGSNGLYTDSGHVHPSTGLLVNVAATPVAGYNLVNGTGNIITWTAPNDGALHRVLVHAGQHVTSTETGGAITLTVTQPDGSTYTAAAFAGGGGTGAVNGFTSMHPVEANTTVTFAQTSALTVGAAVLWAEIWAA